MKGQDTTEQSARVLGFQWSQHCQSDRMSRTHSGTCILPCTYTYIFERKEPPPEQAGPSVPGKEAAVGPSVTYIYISLYIYVNTCF